MKKLIVGLIGLSLCLPGCLRRHCVHVTAYPLSSQNQGEPAGIPYYLPKPLLVVAKNVRHIDESKVGLTTPAPTPNAFDDQGSYGSVKANVTVPGSTPKAAVNAGDATLPTAFGATRPSAVGLGEKMTPAAEPRLDDEVAPDSFFTYQVIFVPDLSQKYVLQVKGGAGEVRAAMNMVNGWMYTGMGPYYMKDSSTAQNIMAAGAASMFAGRGVADVVNEVGDLARVAAAPGTGERAATDADTIVDSYTRLARVLQSETVVPSKMLNYAEIYIYEPTLMPDGSMAWNLIAEHHFDRDYFQPTMNANAMGIFEEIIKQQGAREERARREAKEERAEIREDARAERGFLGRAATGGGMTVNFHSQPNSPSSDSAPGSLVPSADGSSSGNAVDLLPPANGNPAAPSGVTPGAAVLTPEDQVFDAAARNALRLPSPSASNGAAPQTQVNVNVGPKHMQGRPGSRLLRFFHRDPPKQETRVQRSLDVNPTGGGAITGGAVDSVTNQATSPGRHD